MKTALTTKTDGPAAHFMYEGESSPVSELKGFSGELLESDLYRGERLILLVGLGRREDLTPERLRRAAGIAVKEARKYTRELTLVPPETTLPKQAVADALVEGAILADYRFERYKSEPEKRRIERLRLAMRSVSLEAAHQLTGGVILARDLVNTPAIDMNPAHLEREARALAKRHGLKLTVFDAKELRRRKMGATLAVGQGSAVPPRVIILEHQPRGATRHLVFCGKGVCYDSGGYNLKDKMQEYMKDDMGGAAALLGMLDVVAARRAPVRVTVIIGAVENLISGNAYKPGDVVRAMNGKSIEVANTDAEGRLVLADCLSYASTLKHDALIDVATLTGAAMVALGTLAAAVCTPNDELCDSLLKAGERSGDRLWRLPLWDDYREDVKSEIADVKNLGHSFYAGSIAGAAFLQEFVTEPSRWAHIDIGAAVMEDRARPYIPKGATGWGVRALTAFVENLKRG